MKINNLKINGFGKLENKEINLSENINLIYGKNEAGKTTLLKFISGMFYGISKNKNKKEIPDYEKYKPWKAEEYSGKIEYILDNKETFEVFRDFNKKNPKIYKNSEDISNEFNINKTKGNEFFYEQTNVDEQTFLSTTLVEQKSVVLESEEQNGLIQKIANLLSTGEENVSYKKTITQLSKRQTEEVGTLRTVGKPLNILNQKIDELTKIKKNEEIDEEQKNELEKSQKTTRNMIEEKTNKLELIKKINSKKIEENIQKEKIKINETYKNNNYLFDIEYKNKNITFSYDNKFYKAKKVIKDILVYEKDDLVCIYPILKNNKFYNIICSKDNNIYHYNYFKDELTDFTAYLQEKGYFNSSWINNEVKKNMGNVISYYENINKDTYIYVWKYNGFYTFNNKKQQMLDIFKNDTYVNNLGVKVGKYYVLPNYDEKYKFSKFYIINMTNNRIKTLKLDKKITNDYYNNGVIDNKLYLFDVDNLIQYKLNPKKNKIEKISNTEALFYDNDKFIKRNLYDFKENKLIFNEKQEDVSFDYKKLFVNDNDYYYLDKNNNMIYYNKFFDNKMILFNIKDISNIKLVNNYLYFISEDILYSFNIDEGIKMLIKYSEFYYNPTNRYEIYTK